MLPQPQMLALARSSHGLSQTALAKRLKISQQRLSNIEAGAAPFEESLAARVADDLDCTLEFLRSEPLEFATETTPFHHRKLQSVGANALAQIHARIQLIQFHVRELLKASGADQWPQGFIPLELAEYPGGASEIAQIIRTTWSVTTGPISNLVRLAETAGAIVVLCDFATTRIDGLSRLIPGLPPMIFLNQRAPGDRQRRTLAHEIGHLVMHIGEAPCKNLEVEAEAFASELLMPRRELARDFIRGVGLPRLCVLKAKWRCSIASLVMRARDLDVISDAQKKNLFIQLSKRGWRTSEPVHIEPEAPTSIRQVIEKMRDNGLSLSEIAARAKATQTEFVRCFYPDRRGLRIVP